MNPLQKRQRQRQALGRAWLRQGSAGVRPAPVGVSPTVRPINEVWWGAVSPGGVMLWSHLGVTEQNVIEILERSEGPYWRERGWRIAKLQVSEITRGPQPSTLNPQPD